MATIDTGTIRGFDAMTDADKVSALLAFRLPDAPDMSGYVQKSVFDAKASEVASLSREPVKGSRPPAAPSRSDRFQQWFMVAPKGKSWYI